MKKQNMIKELEEILGAEGLVKAMYVICDEELITKVYNVIKNELEREC